MVQMTTRLWYQLPAVLRLAEQARRTTASDRRRLGGPTVPSLLFTDDHRYLLTSTAVSVPLREHTLRPLHLDGLTVPPFGPASSYHLPLTIPDGLPGIQLGDLLRRAARLGQQWFTIDVGTIMAVPALRVGIRAWRAVDAAPADAVWRPAMVRAFGLGPYLAQVAVGYRYGTGNPAVRFGRDSLGQLTADTARPATFADRTLRFVLDGDRLIITSHGAPVRAVGPDAGGLYQITGLDLPWTVEPDSDLVEPVFEPIGPNGEVRCTVCGSVEDPDHQTWPSMLGSGEEFSTRCTLCGSTQSSHPFNSEPTEQRATWPPAS